MTATAPRTVRVHDEPFADDLDIQCGRGVVHTLSHIGDQLWLSRRDAPITPSPVTEVRCRDRDFAPADELVLGGYVDVHLEPDEPGDRVVVRRLGPVLGVSLRPAAHESTAPPTLSRAELVRRHLEELAETEDDEAAGGGG